MTSPGPLLGCIADDFTGATDDGATATWSVEACICGWLRRQYAIGSLPSIRGHGRAV